VRAAHAEPGLTDDALHALAAELHLLGEWLELAHVEVEGRGDLAPALRRAVAKGPGL
jgi:uncharacterized protein YcaQ